MQSAQMLYNELREGGRWLKPPLVYMRGGLWNGWFIDHSKNTKFKELIKTQEIKNVHKMVKCDK